LPREAIGSSLVEAARQGESVAPRIARALGVPETLACEILKEESGHALAVAAKALGLNRAAFSTLVLLTAPEGKIATNYRRLDAFEALSAAEASRELRRWTQMSHAA
jgi:hypothetical protein